MKRAIAALPILAILAGCDLFKPTTDSTPPPPANQVLYTAVGASDAIGYGGSVVCIPFSACPNGTGYVPVVSRRLTNAGKAVTLLNLGIPGAVLSPQIETIGNGLGRGIPGNILEREAPFIQKDATLVTVFAGGNDANTIGAAVQAGLGGVDPTGYLLGLTSAFGQDMKDLVALIRSRAPAARIVVLNLPNFAAMPYVSTYTLAQKKGLQQISVAMSAQINTLTALGVVVVDLMCEPRWYQASTYSSDGFHPGDVGYALMADLVYAAATAATSTPPKTSCSQMTVF